MKRVQHWQSLGGRFWAIALIATVSHEGRSMAQVPDEPHFRLENFPFQAGISYADGRLAGPEIHAQLYYEEEGESANEFKPLFPIATITSDPRFSGYLNTEFVFLPPPYFSGENVKVQVRAFDGTTWETSMLRGESITLEMKLLAQVHGPNLLTGLEPFSLYTVPEPGTCSLLVVGSLALVGLVRVWGRGIGKG